MPPMNSENKKNGAEFEIPKSIVSSKIYAETTAGSDTAVIGNGAGVNAQIIIGIALLGSIFLVILASVLIFYMRKRIHVVNGKVKLRVRPREPLFAERYITNPLYGVCGDTACAPGSGNNNIDADESHVMNLDRKSLTFFEQLGEGYFGKVYKGLLRTTTGEQAVAIKVLKESTGRCAEEDFAREVSVMLTFRHPNIVALIGVVRSDHINSRPWMIFEYMKWGDLAGVLRSSRGGGKPGFFLDEPSLVLVALQVARGMQYLASRHFVHQDLAARNCLVGAQLTVKIADFGMSRNMYTCDYYKMYGERPKPVRWMAPETIVHARFTHESDVWSFGVVLWEIYSRGKKPFYGYSNEDVSKRILDGILLVPPEGCPPFAREIMRACWAKYPKDRIDFDEICKKLEAAEAADISCDYLKTIPDPDPDSNLREWLLAGSEVFDFLTQKSTDKLQY